MTERSVVHVDMDAFYASVEQRDDPALAGRAVIVGGPGRRSVVSTASYEARRFGVHSAMPLFEARRRCPEAVVVPVRIDRYAEVSAAVFAIFGRFTPLVEGLSLDEAFLDVTRSASLFGDGEAIARRVKAAIHDELHLTASAGVASSKFVAKIASDLRKPDGLVVVRPGEERAFLAPLPIERMWGLGPKSTPRARALGFATLGDLAEASDERLLAAFGDGGPGLGALARGEDDRDVEPDRDALSIGAEETFDEDLVGAAALLRPLLAQAARVAARLVAEKLVARGVTVKIKDSDFKLMTRSLTLAEGVADTEAIFGAARELLGRFPLAGRRVRLTGVAAGRLEPAQGELFSDPRREKARRLEEIKLALEEKFGEGSLVRGTLLEPSGRRR